MKWLRKLAAWYIGDVYFVDVERFGGGNFFWGPFASKSDAELFALGLIDRPESISIVQGAFNDPRKLLETQ